MRQTAMDRWIEAAEADRFCLVAHQTCVRSAEKTPVPSSLFTRLRSMVRPETSQMCRVRATVTRSTVAA